MDVVARDTRVVAKSFYQVVYAFDERSIHFPAAIGHGMVHPRQDVATESNLRIFESSGKDVTFGDVVIEQGDKIGRAQVQGDCIRALTADINNAIPRSGTAHNARKGQVVTDLCWQTLEDFSGIRLAKPSASFNL